MKRNLITGIAMMVAAFFIGTELAQAADLSFSGSIRTRYESNDHGNGDVLRSAADSTGTQVRLNTKAKISDSASAFVQLQGVQTWGNDTSATGNDNDASIGVHQAYFTLKNFAGQPVTAKVGRQEIVLDGHRLFGHTGWSNFAHTHDAIRLTHAHDNMTMGYGYSMAIEQTGLTMDNDREVETHFLHTNFQGVLGGALSTYIVLEDDDCGNLAGTGAAACTAGNSQWWTVGGRQAGKMYGLDYRAEAYWQVGDAANADSVMGRTTVSIDGSVPQAGYTAGHQNRDAYMYGVRVGKAFPGLTWKPKITLWYDYLSGNDDDDVAAGTWAAFDTLYDTGHKFYGFQDRFTGRTGAGTDFLGLQDIAIKLVLKPRAKWVLKADFHAFHTAETVGGNPDIAQIRAIVNAPSFGAASNNGDGRGMGSHIANELDMTLIHKYSPGVKFVFGYSQFMAETLYHSLQNTGNARGNANTMDWYYVMAHVKF